MVGTTVATCMGAGAVMADVGFLHSIGIGAVAIMGTFHIGWIALILMAKRLRASGASTLPDFLGKRFAVSTKAIAGTVTLVFMLSSTAAQMAAAGTIMEVLGLTDKTMGIISGGVIILLLTVFGGLYSVAVTDTIQAVLLTIGCGIIIPIVAFSAAGGPTAVFDKIREVKPEMLGFTSISPIMIVGYIMTYALSAGSHAAYAQRIMASVDEKTAFWGSIISNILAFVISLPIISVGFAAHILFPDMTNGEMSVPMVISTYFPPIVKGVMISSLIALVITTADSFLVLLGANASNDIFKLLKPHTASKKLLFVSRSATVIGGVLAILLALSGGSVFQIIRTGAASYGAGMFIPLLCACCWKKATTLAVNTGMLIGCFSSIVWNLTLRASTGVNGVLIGAALCLIAVLSISLTKPETC
jgi:SSS family solute:Na+ symporter